MNSSLVALAQHSATPRALIWDGEVLRFHVTREERRFLMHAVNRISEIAGTRVRLGRGLCCGAWEFLAGPRTPSVRALELADGKRQPIACCVDPDDAVEIKTAIAVAREAGIVDEVEALLAFAESVLFPVGLLKAQFSAERAQKEGGGDSNPHEPVSDGTTHQDANSSPSDHVS